MKVEVVQDARRKWNIKTAFPNLHFCFLLPVAWPYIYICIGTRASAYARGLLGEIIHPYLPYGASGRHRVA